MEAPLEAPLEGRMEVLREGRMEAPLKGWMVDRLVEILGDQLGRLEVLWEDLVEQLVVRLEGRMVDPLGEILVGPPVEIQELV